MKHPFLILLFALLFAATARAAYFSPTLLTIEADEIAPYAFDGSPFELPFTVSGTPAEVVFLVFTKDRAEEIGAVRNGFLGWHYVNKVDTCVYFSPSRRFDPGQNTVTWDGKDQDGNTVPPGEYTYYLWGFDSTSPKQLVSKYLFHGWGFDYRTDVQETDEHGLPMANPIWHTATQRWRIGADPLDESLLETTEISLPENWHHEKRGKPLLHPGDFSRYYVTVKNPEKQLFKIGRFRWVPGGQAELDTSFGTEGYSDQYESPGISTGVITDGTYLFTADDNHVSTSDPLSRFFWYDYDGTLLRSVSLADWWCSQDDLDRGGQMNGGPNTFDISNGKVFLGGHVSCLNQMVDPGRYMATGSLDDFFAWSNANGDYVLDKNFEETAQIPWACNDYNVAPYKYSFSADDMLFSQSCVYDIGEVSFGLLAPDGTGIGYFAFAGETNGWKKGSLFLDGGTPYDGIYCDNMQTGGTHYDWDKSRVDPGIFFVAHDSMRGIITTAGAYVWLQRPVGGETLGAGSAHTIRWSSNDVDRVTIEYSIDGGSTWTVIASAIDAAARAYSWTAPDITSDRCLVRVSDATDASVSDVTDRPFTISQPYVRVVSPNGGEMFEAGTIASVAWEQLGVEILVLEFSTDGGATWSEAATGISAALASYAWTVPDNLSENCLVRLSDASSPAVVDVSDAPFTVSASFVSLARPNGGETLEGKTSYEIAWSASRGVTAVSIEYSSDGGTTWREISGSVSSSAKTFAWNVPLLESDRCLVRISSTDNPSLTDMSDDVFSILPPQSWYDGWFTWRKKDGLCNDTLWTVAADDRGGVWVGGDSGGASYFDGEKWTTYSESNSGIRRDNIYAIIVDHDGVVWFAPTWGDLMSFDGTAWRSHPGGIDDLRDIRVDNDNALWMGSFRHGIQRYDGSTWTVWTSGNSQLRDGSPEVLAIGDDNVVWIGYKFGNGASRFDGETWTHYTTANGLASNEVRGLALDLDGAVWFGTSRGVTRFDGETWRTWRRGDGLVSDDVYSVAVDLDGVMWFGTSAGVSSFDGETWRTYQSMNTALESNNIFEIAVDANNIKWFATRGGGVTRFNWQSGPTVRIVSPNGGELWEAGSPRTVEWTARQVDAVTLEFSSDGGSGWTVIASGIDAAAGAFEWTLPDIASENCIVRISDSSDASTADTSNRPFTVSPPFVRIAAPVGGERWAQGTVHDIAWTDIGVERVTISYSTDDGATWTTIVENQADTGGSYRWTIPAAGSPSCRVRVADADNPDRYDVSDDAFTIMEPFVEVLFPNGGEALTDEQATVIKWESDGVERVRIEYTVDSGATWNVITQNADAERGSWEWNPYPVQSMLCFVRITDTANPDVWDESDTIFSYFVTREVSVEEDAPGTFAVSQNAPNPFNAATTIPFTVPGGTRVTVEVFNISGQRVAELADGFFPAGRHENETDSFILIP